MERLKWPDRNNMSTSSCHIDISLSKIFYTRPLRRSCTDCTTCRFKYRSSCSTTRGKMDVGASQVGQVEVEPLTCQNPCFFCVDALQTVKMDNLKNGFRH